MLPVGELWRYFSKFHGAPDPNDPEGKEKYKEVDDYKIYVADGFIYEIKHMKRARDTRILHFLMEFLKSNLQMIM